MPVGEVALALGVPAGQGVWRVWTVLESVRGFGGFWSGPGVPAGQCVWRVWTVLESARRVWRVLEGFGGFGGFGGFWRVFGGFGGFWSVRMVLERLECLRAGKRQL